MKISYEDNYQGYFDSNFNAHCIHRVVAKSKDGQNTIRRTLAGFMLYLHKKFSTHLAMITLNKSLNGLGIKNYVITEVIYHQIMVSYGECCTRSLPTVVRYLRITKSTNLK